MGYSVSLELPDAALRSAYDAAAEELGVEHAIDSWHDEPEDWEIRRLWDGGSMWGDASRVIRCLGKEVKGDDGDDDGAGGRFAWCEPDVIVPTSALTPFEKAAQDLHGLLGEELELVEALDEAGDEDGADELWMSLSMGVTEVERAYATVPLPAALDVPKIYAVLTHDDPNQFWSPAMGEARDAVNAEWHAKMRLDDLLRKASDDAGPAEEVEGAKAALAAAHDRVAATPGTQRPVMDTVCVNVGDGGKVPLRLVDMQVSWERERIDRLAGARFKAKVAKAILGSGLDADLAREALDLMNMCPGSVRRQFARIGEVAKVAERAGIDGLVWSAG